MKDSEDYDKSEKSSKSSKVSEYTEIYAWGDDEMGQLGVGGTNNFDQYRSKKHAFSGDDSENPDLKHVCSIPKICSFNIKILNISCGFNHSALLSYSGYLYTMGSNEYGKLGVGIDKSYKKNIPCLVYELQDFFITNISCGWYHTAAVSEEGKLFTWGRGKLGVLGHGNEESYPLPEEVTFFKESNIKVATASCGMCHMGVISDNASLYLWGCNQYGQLGNEQIDQCSLLPSEDPTDRMYIEAACGLTHTLALTRDGKVYAAGDNDEGQCGLGKKDLNIYQFEYVEGLSEFIVSKVVAGCHSAAITSNEDIYVWGTSTFGQFLAPERSISLTGVIDASIGRSSGAAVDRTGKVWTWGYNEHAQLGLVDTEPRCIPTMVKPIKKKKVYSIAVGAAHVIAMGENKICNSKRSEKTKDSSLVSKKNSDREKRNKSSENTKVSKVVKPNDIEKILNSPAPVNLSNSNPKTLERSSSQPPSSIKDSKSTIKSESKIEEDRKDMHVKVLSFSENELDKVNTITNIKNEQPQTEKSKEDLVDAISSAAKKLIEDPNSYYNNLKKSGPEVQTKFLPNDTQFLGCEKSSNEKVLDTPELGKIKSENRRPLIDDKPIPIEKYIPNTVESKPEIKPTSSSTSYKPPPVSQPRTGSFREPREKSSSSRTTSATRPAYGSGYLKDLRNPKAKEPSIPKPIMIIKEVQADLECLKCQQTIKDCKINVQNRMTQLENDNERLTKDLRELKNKFSDKECELMIENQKLCLENQDLNRKMLRFDSTKTDHESEIDSLRKEIQRLKDENSHLRIESKQDYDYKETKIKELDKQNKDLREQCERYKSLEAISKERLKAYAQKHIKGASGSNVDEQRRLIRDLMNYRVNDSKSAIESKQDPYGHYDNKAGQVKVITEGDEDFISCLETPARGGLSNFHPSSEEAFMRQSKRNFTTGYPNDENVINEAKHPEDETERNMYTGINSSKNELNNDESMQNTKYDEYHDQVMKGIERRAGGYEPVFCKLDDNQDDLKSISKTPQIRFRNFVNSKKLKKADDSKNISEKIDAKENLA